MNNAMKALMAAMILTFALSLAGCSKKAAESAPAEGAPAAEGAAPAAEGAAAPAGH
ncbi:MAG: hypothetical protein OEV94_05060 [Deltaproteobacteria bacterium]|nr:hypothetical protein [Deltaproteobacteria bacterium]